MTEQSTQQATQQGTGQTTDQARDTYCFIIREKDWDSDAFSPDAGPVDPELADTLGAHAEFAQAVAALGARVVGGEALQNASYGGMVTPGAGDRKVEDAVYSDSPYADTSDLITGFYLVECDDEAMARHVAALVPTGHAVEWRKVFVFSEPAG